MIGGYYKVENPMKAAMQGMSNAANSYANMDKGGKTETKTQASLAGGVAAGIGGAAAGYSMAVGTSVGGGYGAAIGAGISILAYLASAYS